MKGLLVGDIKDDDESLCTVVVSFCNGMETLLTDWVYICSLILPFLRVSSFYLNSMHMVVT